jgi:hypothetical protein
MNQNGFKDFVWIIVIAGFCDCTSKARLQVRKELHEKRWRNEKIKDSLIDVASQSQGRSVEWESVALFNGEHRYWFLGFYLGWKVGGKGRIDRLEDEDMWEIELDLNNDKVKRIQDFVQLPSIFDTITRKDRWSYYNVALLIANNIYQQVGDMKCMVILKYRPKNGFYVACTDLQNGKAVMMDFFFLPMDERESIYKSNWYDKSQISRSKRQAINIRR